MSPGTQQSPPWTLSSSPNTPVPRVKVWTTGKTIYARWGPSAAISQLTVVFTARYIKAPKVWASLPRTNWSSPKRSKVTRGLQHNQVNGAGPTANFPTAWANGHPYPLDAAAHRLSPCST